MTSPAPASSSSSDGTSSDAALLLLRDTVWFRNAPPALLSSLSSSMVRVPAQDNHVFIEEGEEIDSVLIIESGTLRRTKQVFDDFDVTKSIRRIPRERRGSVMAKSTVTVDEISGRGRVTGLLHNLEEGSEAYATVASVGPSVVWTIDGESFRDVASSPREHAQFMMMAMSRELRSGSKSLRGLIEKVRGSPIGGGGGGGGDEGKSSTAVVRVLCYDTTSWVSQGFEPAIRSFNSDPTNRCSVLMDFTTERLSERSATYAAGYDAACLFVNDDASSESLRTLSLVGVRCVAMRCAGYDRLDVRAASAYGLTVCRVPAYSPYAVAEMAVALLMSVNRKIHRANNRVKMGNFSLDGALIGVDVHGKTVGVMGTGKIGRILCDIVLGFGADLLCYDVYESDEIKEKGGAYVSKEEILSRSDILFLMMPLLPATKHTINDSVLPLLKRGMILINTSRGGLVDTKALLKGLQSGTIAGAGMDVYENEAQYFFQDWSARHIQDPDLVALLGNNNVVLTAHQAFFTKEAVDKIVGTTLENLRDFRRGRTGHSHPNSCLPKS